MSLLLKFDLHHWIAWFQKSPVRRKDLGDISYTRCVIGDFVLHFVAMATGAVVIEFVWHSIARQKRLPIMRKHLGDISYTRWVIGYSLFCLKFRCHDNVGRLKIWLHSVNPAPETPVRRRMSRIRVVEFDWQHLIVAVLWSRDSSALEFIYCAKVLVLVSTPRTQGLGLGLEFFKKVSTTTLNSRTRKPLLGASISAIFAISLQDEL